MLGSQKYCFSGRHLYFKVLLSTILVSVGDVRKESSEISWSLLILKKKKSTKALFPQVLVESLLTCCFRQGIIQRVSTGHFIGGNLRRFFHTQSVIMADMSDLD